MSTPDNISDISKIQKDILWGVYLDLHNQSRHNEILRSNAVNFVLVMASALIAVITFDKDINRYDLPLCVLVVIIGLIGSLFSTSFTELTVRDKRRGRYILHHLDDSYFKNQAKITLAQIQENADEEQHKTTVYRWGRRITGSAHIFWLVPPLGVLVIGILLTFLAAHV